MNMSEIEAAIERGNPFAIQMADGKEYRVPHRDYIAVPPKRTFVVVFDDVGHAYVLPLLTMTGLSYEIPASGSP